jgi:hypothetical protein
VRSSQKSSSTSSASPIHPRARLCHPTPRCAAAGRA